LLNKNTERFHKDLNQSEKILRFIDPADSKVWAFLVIDNTIRGPALGGIRMAQNIKLTEIRRLAHIMSLKNSLAQLPYGGGKMGIAIDPEIFRHEPNARSDFFSMIAETLFQEDSYIPAPDMGTNEQDTQVIYEVFSQKLGTSQHGRGGASRPEEKDGIPIDVWGLTAHGLFSAVQILEKTEENFTIKGSRVVIQGYGNVGSFIAQKLFDVGAIIVGVSDINMGLWHSKGLDINELNRVRFLPGGLKQYQGVESKRFTSEQLDWILEAPCDLLIPCARPDSISSRNADRIDCKFIIQGANIPSNKMTEYYLFNRRKIPSLSDIVLNSGGVIGCAAELQMTRDQNFRNEIQFKGTRKWVEDRVYQTVAENVSKVFHRMEVKERDTIFREEAQELAIERLEANL
tara:strand:+ start:444 stop:1649 length:1206 start_codon:yes stop_codon:yes gene_type:complete